MGGMAMLNFLAITLSEGIAKERDLEPVYGDLNRDDLVELQKELLLFAFADDQENAFLLEDDGTTTNSILYRHCELGLMTDPSYFVSLLLEQLQVLYDYIVEERVMMECANLVAELRALLEATHAKQMQKRKQKQKQSSFNTILTSISEHTDTEMMEDQKKKQEKHPFKRLSLFRRRHNNVIMRA
jgi:hypothetical protein